MAHLVWHPCLQHVAKDHHSPVSELRSSHHKCLPISRQRWSFAGLCKQGWQSRRWFPFLSSVLPACRKRSLATVIFCDKGRDDFLFCYPCFQHACCKRPPWSGYELRSNHHKCLLGFQQQWSFATLCKQVAKQEIIHFLFYHPCFPHSLKLHHSPDFDLHSSHNSDLLRQS